MASRCSFILLSLLLAGGCFQQDSNKASQILLGPPAQVSYLPVRGCRQVKNGHDSKYIKVSVNSGEAQQAYNAGNCPLPQDSVIVAEEFNKPDCSSLSGYSLMFKDTPGYDPAASDWHWQKLDEVRGVLEDGRVRTCIDCHATCVPARDLTCSPP
jgi:hypothetical protein